MKRKIRSGSFQFEDRFFRKSNLSSLLNPLTLALQQRKSTPNFDEPSNMSAKAWFFREDERFPSIPEL